MSMAVQETGTRGSILEMLKRTGGMTASDLGNELGITPMAARQHLAVLAAEGLVQTTLRRSGVGRPSSVYALTEKGQETFPRLYDDMLLMVLDGVRDLEGQNGIDAILEWRARRMVSEYGPKLEKLPPEEKIEALFDALRRTYHMPEMRQSGDEIIITEYNCPIARVSRRFPEICRSELDIMRELAGLPVDRDACMAHGAGYCRYRFKLVSPQ